ATISVRDGCGVLSVCMYCVLKRTAGERRKRKTRRSHGGFEKSICVLSRSRSPPKRRSAFGRANRPYTHTPARCLQGKMRIQPGKFREHHAGRFSEDLESVNSLIRAKRSPWEPGRRPVSFPEPSESVIGTSFASLRLVPAASTRTGLC